MRSSNAATERVVICGSHAYPAQGKMGDVPYPGFRIRWRGGERYQALINSRWRNVAVATFMDWDPHSREQRKAAGWTI